MASVNSLSNESLQDLNATETTVAHAEMIRSKPILQRIYQEHYDFFHKQSEKSPSGLRVELGSGGGFIKNRIPEVITSDLVSLSGIDAIFSGLQLPFEDQSIGSIFMINVLHHLQNVEQFFMEACRSLKPGGRIALVEPANTLWSSFIYKNFHHEPFDPKQNGWALPMGGRMTSANDALPWIVFCRDRAIFEQHFPNLQIESVQCLMPFSYILSGGVSRPQFIPSWGDAVLKFFELLISPLNPLLGLFMRVVLVKS